jgi:tetratricopeptide (TPR) repeat protein
LVHDIELSTSLLTPWSTLPAIAGIIMLLVLAGFIARKRPLIAFCILFFFLNHVIESSFIPLELIFEHRNYIPSMFFFVPIVIFILQVIDYFSYKKVVQLTMVAVLTFFLSAQGHTVFARNALFANPILLWTDNVEKAPNLSRPYKNLGSAYGNLGFHDKAYVLYTRALSLDRYTNLLNRAINLQNMGLYHLSVTGEYDRALGFFKSALEVSPGYGPAYHGAAVCFIRKGDLTEAESRLMAALSIWPDSANLRNAQGFVLLKMGKYDQSVKEAQQALLLNPDLSDALCILGEASRSKGNYGLATLYWQSYIEKNPNDLQGNLALIELYARQNKKDNLSQTIGKLMVLKGSKSWHELINQLVRDSNRMVYIPDSEPMISIIRGNLDDQFRR